MLLSRLINPCSCARHAGHSMEGLNPTKTHNTKPCPQGEGEKDKNMKKIINGKLYNTETATFSSRDVSAMVEDFLADHADEYADDPIVLDGELVYDGDCHEYVQPCHDSDHSYLLVPYMVSGGGGNISIEIV